MGSFLIDEDGRGRGDDERVMDATADGHNKSVQLGGPCPCIHYWTHAHRLAAERLLSYGN